MNKLKKQIMLVFLIVSFSLSVSLSIFDSLFEELVLTNLSGEIGAFLIGLFLIFQILIFIGFSYIFYRLISAKIKAEVDRSRDSSALLFANLAHDIKTPLTSVIGYGQALEDGLVDKDHLQNTYKIIRTKGEQANEVLTALIDYTRLTSSDIVLNLKEVDLVRLLRDSLANNFEFLEKKNMEVELKGLDSLKLKVDSFHLGRAFNNLILNAIKHNPEGTDLIVEVKDKSIGFFDNGSDMSCQDFESYLKPFTTGRADRSSGTGSGLGLSLTYEILKKHGFDLHFSKKDSYGYKGFVIIL